MYEFGIEKPLFLGGGGAIIWNPTKWSLRSLTVSRPAFSGQVCDQLSPGCSVACILPL